jgi:hypothetical protein
MIIKNTDYAPELALGMRRVSGVSHGRLLELLWYEDLLLILFDDLHIPLIVSGPELHQVVLYMHAIMTQHLALRQQQLLKCNAHAKLQS